jgi:hypothetical protein
MKNLIILFLSAWAFNLQAAEIKKIRDGKRGHYTEVSCVDRWELTQDGTLRLESRQIYCNGSEGNASCISKNCGTKPGTIINSGTEDGLGGDFAQFGELTIAEKLKGVNYIDFIENQLEQGVKNGSFVSQEIFCRPDGSTYNRLYTCHWQTSLSGVQTYSVSINN